jgi:hypothetical protein
LGVLPEQLLARAVPVGSNFRLNIDFPPVRKNVSGGICPVAPATRQNFPRPGNLCRAGGQITPLFKKSAGEKSRKSAENIAPRRHSACLTRMNAGASAKAAQMAIGVEEKDAQAKARALKIKAAMLAHRTRTGESPSALKKQGGACAPP